MPSTTLNFRTTHLITGLNVIDGQIYWTDDRNEPRKLEISKFKEANHTSGTTSIFGRSFQERDITVIRPHPTDKVTISFVTDGSNPVPEAGSTNAPAVETFSVVNLETTRAELRGFSFDASDTLIDRGFYFGTATTVDTLVSGGTLISTGLSGNTFEEFASPLTVATGYNYVAFATNAYGTNFGEVIAFTTLSEVADRVLPQVFSLAATNVGSTSFTMNGRGGSAGGDTIADQGFYWGTQDTLEGLIANGQIQPASRAISDFSYTIDTGISPGLTYHYVAYATNSIGTVEGAVIRLVTAAPVVPRLARGTTFNLLTTSASLASRVTDTGGGTVSSRGFLWSDIEITVDELIANGEELLETSSLDGGASFSAELIGLNNATTYYFVPFAVTEVGIGYGTVSSQFTTQTEILLGPPSVTTLGLNLEGSTAIRVRGNVSRENGATITVRGMYLGTDRDQTNLVANGTRQVISGTTGVFTSTFTGLTPGTTYRGVAFATNSQGTTFGGILELEIAPERDFPTIVNTPVVVFTDTTADLGGNVLSSPGFILADRGFIVGTQATETELVNNNSRIQVPPNSLGTFAHTAINLTANTSYYYVSYAENELGVQYSTVRNFRTGLSLGSIPTVATLSVLFTASTSAELRGSLNSDGGRSTTLRGFRVGLASVANANFLTTTAGAGVTEIASGSVGGTEYRLSSDNALLGGMDLEPNRGYKVVAFATNAIGNGFGGFVNFTTRAVSLAPTVVTDAAVNITANSAELRGEVTDSGGGTIDITSRGFRISSTETSAIGIINNGDFIASLSPTNDLAATASGLSLGTTYRYVAVASNTAPGNGVVVSFRTTAEEPTLSLAVSPSFIIVDRLGVPETTTVAVTVSPASADFTYVIGRWGGDGEFGPLVERDGSRLTIGNSGATSDGRRLTITVTHSQNTAITETITLAQSGRRGRAL